MSIERILIRTLPENPAPECEEFGAQLREMHPDWVWWEFREPVNPAQFPLTSRYWDLCTSGAQKAGLIRLEALHALGGVYVDSDYEPYKPFNGLMQCDAFAGFEDPTIIPDAVLGFRREHPALRLMMDLAINRLTGKAERPFGDWRDDAGAWSTGPGVSTTILRHRTDVVLLEPSAFYQIHYSVTRKRRVNWAQARANAKPWQFGQHRWHGSWL